MSDDALRAAAAHLRLVRANQPAVTAEQAVAQAQRALAGETRARTPVDAAVLAELTALGQEIGEPTETYCARHDRHLPCRPCMRDDAPPPRSAA